MKLGEYYVGVPFLGDFRGSEKLGNYSGYYKACKTLGTVIPWEYWCYSLLVSCRIFECQQ